MAENLEISDKTCYNITQQQSPEFQWNMGPAKRGNLTEYKSTKKKAVLFLHDPCGEYCRHIYADHAEIKG